MVQLFFLKPLKYISLGEEMTFIPIKSTVSQRIINGYDVIKGILRNKQDRILNY